MQKLPPPRVLAASITLPESGGKARRTGSVFNCLTIYAISFTIATRVCLQFRRIRAKENEKGSGPV